jgi:DNA invertase Pin-like site-specific DNA recombinase
VGDDCEGTGRLRDGREVLRTKDGTRHAQEHKMSVRCVKAGLAARKAKGGRLGRVPLAMSIQNKARWLRENGLSYAAIGKELKISKGSAFNACKEVRDQIVRSAP